MTLTAKIETIIRNAADHIHQEELRTLTLGTPTNPEQRISKIVHATAEYIRREVLAHAVAHLEVPRFGSPQTASPKKRSDKAKVMLKELTRPKTKIQKNVRRNPGILIDGQHRLIDGQHRLAAVVRGPSDDVLKMRIRQIVFGRDDEGFSVQSLFQRLLNHKDTAGKGVVTLPRITRLVNELVKDKFLVRDGKFVQRGDF